MSLTAAFILILFYIYYVEPRRARDRERQLELLSTIAENTARIAEATETTTLTVWDHWQWIRERTS